jgi:tRNA threonylcarbamoyladenosine biosynthesis protein TsaB
MIILTVRTDKPEAEISLYDGETCLVSKTWLAHRQLAETLHTNIKTLLEAHNLSWQELAGIVFYSGPGSFTGLRIGAAFTNALALANNIPCASKNGIDWIGQGITYLSVGKNEPALPFYGAEPHITTQKK